MNFSYLSLVIFCFMGFTSAQEISNFKLKNIQGGYYELYQSEYSYKVINFWATWCLPCVQEMDFLKEIYPQFQQEVEFISISMDDYKTQSKVPQFIFSRQYPFTVLIDSHNKVTKANTILNPPYLLILNDKNQIVFSKSGFKNSDQKSILREIEKLLKDS